MFRQRPRSQVGPPPASNGAVAAALTIGQNLKSKNPAAYKAQSTRNGSLLKRSTSSSTVSRAPKQVVEYSVDDSFNDSALEQMGHEADAHYANRRRVEDLKLPQSPTVKMVKKYIPTPNGIKVVEVPEEEMKKQIERLNLLRGFSSRTSSLRNGSLSRVPRLPSLTGRLPSLTARLPSLTTRLPSFTLSTPKPSPLAQSRTRPPKTRRHLQTVASAVIENVEEESKEESNELSELAALERRIAEEKRLAAQLEAKRVEYEELKARRVAAEDQLARDREKESIERKEKEAKERQEKEARERQEREAKEREERTRQERQRQEEEKKRAEDEKTDVVAEAMLKGAAVGQTDAGSVAILPGALSPEPQISPEIPPRNAAREMDYSSDEVSIKPVPGAVDELDLAAKSGLEIDPQDALSQHLGTATMAQHLRPVFDDASEKSERSDRPIKSAMKQLKLNYQMVPNGPAHQAYLQLTTAENTRLNLKLSVPLLDQPRLPDHLQRRMLQLLRKLPSLQPQTLSSRNLREGRLPTPEMAHPQPIQPHPALQPGYQSPLKAKAAELYARANARPRLMFQARPKEQMTTLRQQPQQQPPLQQPQQQPARGGFHSRFNDSDDEPTGPAGFQSRFNDSDEHLPTSAPAAAPVATLRNPEPAPKPKKKRFLRKLFSRDK